MDNLFKQSIRSLREQTAEIRLRNDHLEAEQATVQTSARQALHRLLAPLDDVHLYLLEATDSLERMDLAKSTTEQSIIEESPSDEEEKGPRHAEYVFLVGDTPIYAWEWLGEEYTEWIVSISSLTHKQC